MKAPIAQAAAEAASPLGCVFFSFWGLEIVKCIKNPVYVHRAGGGG
jgi:peroxiredoxin family protein